MHERRLNTYAVDPTGFKTLVAWATHVAGGLDPALRALVEARASQLNGCAFCLAMHNDEGRRAGVPQEKLDTLAGWRDDPAYDERERAALALTEEMTRLADGPGVADQAWDAARAQFDDAELAALVQVVAAINAFNRINVATGRTAADYAAYRLATAARGGG
jgi:AhpD family alkylhydroperoxidase